MDRRSFERVRETVQWVEPQPRSKGRSQPRVGGRATRWVIQGVTTEVIPPAGEGDILEQSFNPNTLVWSPTGVRTPVVNYFSSPIPAGKKVFAAHCAGWYQVIAVDCPLT